MLNKTILHYKVVEKLGEGGIPTFRDPAGKGGNWL